MQYTICPKAPGEFEFVVVDDDSRRWLVTVTRVAGADLLIQVSGLNDAPLQLNEAEVISHTVGFRRMPHDADLDEIAQEVTYILVSRDTRS